MRLFSGSTLYDFLEKRKSAVISEIASYNAEYILSVNETELTEYFYQRHSITPPSLQEDQIEISPPEDIDIDIRDDPSYFVRDRSRPAYIKGTRIIIHIPYHGDSSLFNYQPSTFRTSSTEAQVKGDEILLLIDGKADNPERFKSRCDQETENIKDYIDWIRADIEKYQRELNSIIPTEIQKRKEKINRDKALVESLGIPLKRRDDAQLVIKSPEIRRKISVAPPARVIPAPEPVLDYEEFKNILEIIKRLVLAMERSPKTFSKLEEEELRDFILVILNEHYEGQATGETFNAEGKTDIFVRINKQNIFIAECKFWRGPAEFLKAIDQLLRYLSWRDTKTALVVFNKNRDFSNVIKTIKETIVKHPNYKSNHENYSDTQFSYIFHQNGDKSRDVFIAICAFDVPQ